MHLQFLSLNHSMQICIPQKQEWKTFEDYKNVLKSKYRVKANKADSKSSTLKTRIFNAHGNFVIYFVSHIF